MAKDAQRLSKAKAENDEMEYEDEDKEEKDEGEKGGMKYKKGFGKDCKKSDLSEADLQKSLDKLQELAVDDSTEDRKASLLHPRHCIRVSERLR